MALVGFSCLSNPIFSFWWIAGRRDGDVSAGQGVGFRGILRSASASCRPVADVLGFHLRWRAAPADGSYWGRL